MQMANNHSHKAPENDQEIDHQTEGVSDEFISAQDTKRPQKALSKREIMEQLSRERFPWDE